MPEFKAAFPVEAVKQWLIKRSHGRIHDADGRYLTDEEMSAVMDEALGKAVPLAPLVMSARGLEIRNQASRLRAILDGLDQPRKEAA
jgi:hypothetical protein